MINKEDIQRSAKLSEDRLYRYELRRRWGEGTTCCFIGLNPSTADEKTDDMTIKKCMGFAERWGYNSILMLNLFAFRTTYPRELEEVIDPVGPDNDETLRRLIPQMGRVVCAWGANDFAAGRAKLVSAMLPEAYSLGTTKEGHPRHPSRLAYVTELQPIVIK